VFLIQEAIRSANVSAALDLVADGEQALRYIDAVERDDAAECPILIILDINLPKRHGGEVLERLRQTAKCANATVLVVTSSDSSSDREAVAPFGVRAYFRQPSEYDDFMKLGQIVRGLLSDSR
jgi:DNA-binding response OmpR family regulator